MESYHLNPGINNGSVRSLVIIFFLLFIIKSAIVIFIIPQLQSSFPDLYNINQFPDNYDKIAMNLVNGNGYRFYPETAETLMRSPGYVIILAGIFSLFGKSLVAAQIFNIIIAIATAYITFRISKRLIYPSVGNYVAPLLFLLHPGIILSETRGGVEILLTFFIVTFMLFLYRAIESSSRKDFAIAGGVLGLALLVKSTPILFPAFILLYLLLVKPKENSTKSILNNFLVMFASMCVIYSPWVFRNYLVSGKFVATTTLKGAAASRGLYVNKRIFSKKEHYSLLRESIKEEDSLANEAGLRFKPGSEKKFYSSIDEVIFDKLLFDKVIQEYKESPLLLMKCCLLNFIKFWFQGKTHTATLLNIILTVPFISFIIAGIYVGYKNKLNITPMLIFIIAYIIPHLPIIGVARYYIPLIPLLSILACFTLFQFKKYGQGKRELK